MQIDRKTVMEALSTIRDPQTGQDIVTVNMVQDLKIEGSIVSFTLTLPSLNHPAKSDLIFDCQGILQKLYPGVEVNVHVVARQASAGNTTETNTSIPHVKNIIAVASGKGGVGKSTISVNLALGLKKLGARVGLVDADLYGPSIPTMLGLQGKRPQVQEVYGQMKILPLEAYGMQVISIGFIVEPEQAVVLRGPRLAGIIKQFFNEVMWSPLDYLVVDLPPGTGDIQLTLVQTVPVTGAIMVTTPQEVSVVDAVKAMNMFLLPSVNVPIIGVVENMSWFTPQELPDNRYYIFGQGGGSKIAQLAGTMLLGQVPLVQGIRESGDEGKPIVVRDGSMTKDAFLEIARHTMEQVDFRNKMYAPTQVVTVN
jgi:ATP-binding protein involved in chromosome partitioning